MEYDYKVTELEANLTGKQKGGGESARALSNAIEEHAVDGFEFYRVDTFAVQRPAGCLAPGQTQNTSYNVVTFRRPKK